MALDKTITTSTGVEATYWRVIGAVVDFVVNTVQVTVAGYATQELRQVGAKPLTKMYFTLPFTSDPTRAGVYGYLKTTTAFENSQDV